MANQLVVYLANTLSIGTILSCLFLKVPQIINIRRKKSAQGIYCQAILLEIIGFSIVTLYNYTNEYSVMTYLEYPIILLQEYVLLYYVLRYQKLIGIEVIKHMPVVPIALALYVMVIFGFAVGWLHKNLLSYVLPFCTPLSGFAKVTYMFGIIKVGNANSVSRTTWIISILTNISRLFTVYVDSADIKLMLNFLVSSILSTGVLITAVIYQLKHFEKLSKEKKL